MNNVKKMDLSCMCTCILIMQCAVFANIQTSTLQKTISKKITFMSDGKHFKTFCYLYELVLIRQRDRRSGGILFLSCMSFCNSVLLSETLIFLITFEQ